MLQTLRTRTFFIGLLEMGVRGPQKVDPRTEHGGHAVADPALVDDPGWAGGVVAEPVAQPLAVGAHDLRVAVAASGPQTCSSNNSLIIRSQY